MCSIAWTGQCTERSPLRKQGNCGSIASLSSASCSCRRTPATASLTRLLHWTARARPTCLRCLRYLPDQTTCVTSCRGSRLLHGSTCSTSQGYCSRRQGGPAGRSLRQWNGCETNTLLTWRRHSPERLTGGGRIHNGPGTWLAQRSIWVLVGTSWCCAPSGSTRPHQGSQTLRSGPPRRRTRPTSSSNWWPTMSSTRPWGLGRPHTSNTCSGRSSTASTRTTTRPVSSCSATSCDRSRRAITAAATSTTLGGVGPSVTVQILTGTTGSIPCCTLSLCHYDVRLKESIFATCWTPSPHYQPTSVTACARGSSQTPPQPNPAT